MDALAAGSHVLEIAYRENGTRLDKFVIQLDSLTAPQGNGPPESPTVFSIPPVVGASVQGNLIRLEWPESHTGWR